MSTQTQDLLRCIYSVSIPCLNLRPINVELIQPYVEAAFGGDSDKQDHLCAHIRYAYRGIVDRQAREHPLAPPQFEPPRRIEWGDIQSATSRFEAVRVGTPKAAAIAEEMILALLLDFGPQPKKNLVEWVLRWGRRRTGREDVLDTLRDLLRRDYVTPQRRDMYDLSAELSLKLRAVERYIPRPGFWLDSNDQFVEVIKVEGELVRCFGPGSPGVTEMPVQLFLLPTLRDDRFVTRFRQAA